MNNIIIFFVAFFSMESFSANYLINLTDTAIPLVNANYYKKIENIIFCNDGFIYNKIQVEEPSFIDINTGKICSVGDYLNRVVNDKKQCVCTGQNLKAEKIIVTHIANVEHFESNNKTRSIIMGLYRYENDHSNIKKVFIFKRKGIKTITHSYPQKVIKNEFGNGENATGFTSENWSSIDFANILFSTINENDK